MPSQAEDTLYMMKVEPLATAVTTPEPSMVAADVLLLLHVPPVVVLDNGSVCPAHILAMPVIGAGGKGFTVTSKVTKQPELV